jgi:hypothetical protein
MLLAIKLDHILEGPLNRLDVGRSCACIFARIGHFDKRTADWLDMRFGANARNDLGCVDRKPIRARAPDLAS